MLPSADLLDEANRLRGTILQVFSCVRFPDGTLQMRPVELPGNKRPTFGSTPQQQERSDPLESLLRSCGGSAAASRLPPRSPPGAREAQFVMARADLERLKKRSGLKIVLFRLDSWQQVARALPFSTVEEVGPVLQGES